MLQYYNYYTNLITFWIHHQLFEMCGHGSERKLNLTLNKKEDICRELYYDLLDVFVSLFMKKKLKGIWNMWFYKRLRHVNFGSSVHASRVVSALVLTITISSVLLNPQVNIRVLHDSNYLDFIMWAPTFISQSAILFTYKRANPSLLKR